MAALAAAPHYYGKAFGRVEEELRMRMQSQLTERLDNLVVRVRSAHLTGDGIKFRGVSIGEPGAGGPQGELVFVDEVLLACRTSPQELMSGEPLITSITLKRPVIRATRRPDGSFSLARLLPAPKAGMAVPRTTIEGGAVEVFDPLKNPSSTFMVREINLEFQPLETAATPGLLSIEGSLTADHIKRVELTGTLSPQTRQWTVSGTVDGLEVSPELRMSLPQPLAEPMEAIVSLRAPASLSFSASCDDPARPPTYEVNGRVVRGRVDDPMLNYPLTDVGAKFHCDNQAVIISELSLRHGQAVWEVPYLRFTPGSPLDLHATGKQVRLDRSLAGVFPEQWRKEFRNYDPQGEVNVNCTLRYEQGKWKPIVARVDAVSNVSFSYAKFPYRLENAAGSLTLRDDVLYVELTADAGTQPITLAGRFLHPGPNFTGAIEIRGRKIPFDEKLLAALKPKALETVRSLDPRGTFDFCTTLWRSDPTVRGVHQDGVVDLNGCAIKFEKFPYPLSNVRGQLEVHDGNWMFPKKIVGTNGAGQVAITGGLLISPGRDDLKVQLEGTNVPLAEDLKKSLRPAEQQLWDSLRPRGNVDFNAQVTYDSISKKTAVDLRVFPRGDGTNIGTSIEPVAFSYRMENLKGSVHYRDDHVTIEHLEADHRNTKMSSNGYCDFTSDGRWHLHLENLNVNRLRLQGEDQDLVAALPETLRRAVGELRPTGPMNLQGSLDFAKAGPAQPLNTDWNLYVVLHQASLNAGPKLENISGKVHLQGSSRSGRVDGVGYLDLDNLNYKNFQLTEVIGPLSFNNETFRLGAPGAAATGQPNRQVTAKLLGGLVSGDCKVTLGNVPHYDLRLGMVGADLAQFARENLASHHKLSGKVAAQAELHGSRGPHSLSGGGRIRLTEADVYKLPVMLSLLKFTRAKLPDSNAFTDSDVEFQVSGEHVTMQHIELHGDAVDLSGTGEITLDGASNPLRLELHTSIPREVMPLASKVFSEASRQVLVIHVNGPLDSPQVSKEPLPGLAQALEGAWPESERTLSPPQGNKPAPPIFPRR